MDSIHITLEFGTTKLDMVFEPTKPDVVALFDFINSRMDANEDDPAAQAIAGLSERLKTSTGQLKVAITTKPE